MQVKIVVLLIEINLQLQENGSMEKYLHGVELNIVDHDTCDEIYTEFGGITEK